MSVFNELFSKLKDALGGGAPEPASSTPVINERMSRITAGEPFAGPKQKLQNLTGGSKSLTPDQIRAVRHEATRQRSETQAEAVLQKVRAKLGKLKLEQLATVPRIFAPEAVTAFRKQYAQITDEEFNALAEVLPRIDRDVCDDLARVTSWGAAEREKLLKSVPEPQRVRLGEPAVAVLDKMHELVRESALRLPRAPNPKALDALVHQWKNLNAEELRATAHALAQFGDADIPEKVKLPPPKPLKGKPSDKKPPAK